MTRGRRTPAEQAPNESAKGAVLSLTLAMAADHVLEGIRVSCVSPGIADPPWVSRLLDAAADRAAESAALMARRPTCPGHPADTHLTKGTHGCARPGWAAAA
jgi:NAD(P)-dependent dehydrogenase (short-subunit alcohol dehydrogenase family)